MTERLRETLRADGFVRCPSVFDDSELEAVRRETEAMIDGWTAGRLRGDEDYWSCEAGDPPVETLYRIHRFETKSDEPRRLTAHERFRVLRDEVFADGSLPTECAVAIKVPGRGVEVPWHRDPVEADPFGVYNFSIYLDDSLPENGCLHVIPGSHLERGEVPKAMPAGAVPVAAAAGDVLVHDVALEHGSPPSDSAQGRRAVVIEFSAPGSRPGLRSGARAALW